MKKITLLASTLILSCSVAVADPQPPLNNAFISYFSTSNVKDLMTYINKNQLAGFIMWEFRGDMPYQSDTSLLATSNSAINPKNPSMFIGYWSNWSVYTVDPGRAFSEPAYGVPNSLDGATGNVITNPDFSNKLEGLNTITYAFLEAEPITNPLTGITNKNPGTVFFTDPWADLQGSNYSFCSNTSKDVSYADICYTAYLQQNRLPPQKPFTMPKNQQDFNGWVKMGNFSAFAKLKHQTDSNPLGSLKKIFSVGGYGHDDSIENAMSNSSYTANFVNSIDAILNSKEFAGFDGIDLDYENPDMTLEQSQQFKLLVDALVKRLQPENKEIFITILSNPAYISGQKVEPDRSLAGFAPGVLSKIASEITGINLMTYDFHGAFDYDNGKGRTGFLTNIYPYTSPAGVKDPFSVVNAVDATVTAGVPVNKISVGIPAYGRALQGIDQTNGGLSQLIPDALIPRGDLDSGTCSQNIANITSASCSGSFQYQFIMNQMLGKGFTETIWPAGSDQKNPGPGGTTAYANTWTPAAPPSDYKLTIQNTGHSGDSIALDVYIGSQFSSGTVQPEAKQTFDDSSAGSASTKPIDNQKNLTFILKGTWADAPSYSCPTPVTFDFTKNTTLVVSISNASVVTCKVLQQ